MKINKPETSKEFFKRSKGWNSYYKFLSKEWKKLSEQSLRKRERKFQVGNHWRGKRNAMQMPHNLFLQKRKGAITGWIHRDVSLAPSFEGIQVFVTLSKSRETKEKVERKKCQWREFGVNFEYNTLHEIRTTNIIPILFLIERSFFHEWIFEMLLKQSFNRLKFIIKLMEYNVVNFFF